MLAHSQRCPPSAVWLKYARGSGHGMFGSLWGSTGQSWRNGSSHEGLQEGVDKKCMMLCLAVHDKAPSGGKRRYTVDLGLLRYIKTGKEQRRTMWACNKEGALQCLIWQASSGTLKIRMMPFRRNSRNFRDSRCICGAPRKGSTARRLYRMYEMEERRDLVTRARRWSPGVAYDNGRDYGAYYIFAGCCCSGGIPGEELLRVERGRSVSPFHLCYLRSGWVLSAFWFVLFVWLCLLFVCLLLVGSTFTQCNSCVPTARGSLPLTRAGIFTEQATFSDRRSFVRVAAMAQKKKSLRACTALALKKKLRPIHPHSWWCVFDTEVQVGVTFEPLQATGLTISSIDIGLLRVGWLF